MSAPLDTFEASIQVTPWVARTLPLGATAASGVIYPRSCVVTGIVLRETGGTAPAVINIYNGASNTGELVASIYVDKSETRVIYPMVLCSMGVYVSVVSGTVTGAVWVTDSPTS